MATIITKNSSTASAVPAAGNLVQGELAVNVTDKKLYTKDSGGNVVGVGQEPLISGTNIKTVNSTSLLGSGNVAVQETLVSGTNIKTINTASVLGSGDIPLVAPGAVTGSGLTMATNRLLGRTTAATGAIEEISVGSGLSFTGGSISTVMPAQPRLISTSTGSASSSTTLTITAPVGIVSGDLLICLNSTSTGQSWTGDTGWTEVIDSSYFRVAYKVATGSEPASYAFTSSGSANLSGAILLLRNAAYDTIGTEGTGSAPIAGSVTPSALYCLLLAFVTSSANSITVSAPGEFSVIAIDDNGASPSYGIFADSLIGAGPTNTKTFTSSGTNGRAVLVSIKPA